MNISESLYENLSLTKQEREIYINTIKTNEDLLVRNGPKIDPHLVNGVDRRRTFSIFGYYAEEFPVGGSLEFEKSLPDLFPGHIYYTADRKSASKSALLHWTFMQLNGFTEDLVVSESDMEKYVNICSKHLFSFNSSITVDFFGFIATPANIVWVAQSAAPINKVREDIRQDVMKAGLLLKEPYKANIIHSCAVRFLTSFDVESVLDQCRRFRSDLKGSYTFDKLYLDYGSALMRPQEIIHVAEFDLINKAVKLFHADKKFRKIS